MIKAEVRRDRAGWVTGFTVTGHSGFAPHGEDIVCAGVTALSEAAVLGLQRVAGVQPQVEMEDGFVRCELPPLAQAQEVKAQAIIETMILGLRDIAKDYRRYVRITEVNGGE
ncbi:MAG: ribosomal-processing cysteine protease Prp [Firmicutes bacterium]|nr:ribosomal-processing cysteine protease Prp [Bacillota bacterium]